MLKLARVITEVFAPTVLVTVFLLATGGLTAGWFGLLSGFVAAIFTALGPFAGIVVATRKGKLSDHHVGERKQRAPIIIASLVSSTVGLLVLLLMQAPRISVIGLLAVSLGMIVVGVVNVFWKLSVHTAVAAFFVLGMADVLGLWWYLSVVVVLAVAWSRVVLKDHTVAQVCAGALAGAAVGVCFVFIL
ncbi:hypothetical protein [Psychromicrobium lacuslunae]|uniref:Phosphatidic acid phosphatase type 2/haloperoxidase domain-containing protein n=1 Tax=Psychromicrobium lacuslunae TaxID=1618207 RepID=A0A0D4BXY9_9MICC|nr:hypothetical protein [Psychromicrobium lacuslunae]AJT41169.1 hypothetical protein UM93_05930 [Psychromicrobium lacuslunae]